MLRDTRPENLLQSQAQSPTWKKKVSEEEFKKSGKLKEAEEVLRGGRKDRGVKIEDQGEAEQEGALGLARWRPSELRKWS